MGRETDKQFKKKKILMSNSPGKSYHVPPPTPGENIDRCIMDGGAANSVDTDIYK